MVTMKMNQIWLARYGRVAAVGVFVLVGVVAGLVGFGSSVVAQHRMHGQQEKVDRNHPWMNASLSPDQRSGIPIIQMSDAAYGVRSSGENGRYSTALPAAVGAAASWDTEAACAYGTLIGKELRAQGYNMTLGGGVNVTREPRNGRTFEYAGEDPLLAGTIVGNLMKCEQAEHVIGDIKHFAVNDQETGRNVVDAIISKRAMQESDLLAFHMGIKIANPGAVMCSYNRINGDYACENTYTLHDVLKNDWGYKGFVISDWGGTHSTERASAAGLDQEQPMADYFGPALAQAVKDGKVPMAEIDDHV